MEEMCRQEQEKHAQEISLLEENLKKGFASVCQNILSEAMFLKLFIFSKFSIAIRYFVRSPLT